MMAFGGTNVDWKILLAIAPLLLAQVPASAGEGESTAAREIQSVEVTYENGPIALAALLMRPPSETPIPGAVIIQGSGSSDRTNRWSRDFADALVRQGLAVLLTDKRGSGESGGDWRTAGFPDLAGDVLAGVEFLRAQPGVDPGRIGIVGLSQGGQVAPLAASRSDHVAFVISVSSKAVGFAEGSFVEMANTARQAGLAEPDVREVLRLNHAALRYLTTGEWGPYARARERALATGAGGIAEGFPASADEPIWTFLRSSVTYDPLVYWVQVTQPVLIVYGEKDQDDNVPVRESVRRLEHVFRSTGKSNYRIVVVPGSGHGIRDARTRALAPRFLETLDAWLREHVRRRGARE